MSFPVLLLNSPQNIVVSQTVTLGNVAGITLAVGLRAADFEGSLAARFHSRNQRVNRRAAARAGLAVQLLNFRRQLVQVRGEQTATSDVRKPRENFRRNVGRFVAARGGK